MENNHSTSRQLSMGIIAAITWFALLLQLKLSLGTTGTTGFSTVKTITNFFSYFTILSNLLVAISLSSALFLPSGILGRFFTKISVQSAIAVYIFIVGLVYNLANMDSNGLAIGSRQPLACGCTNLVCFILATFHTY
jgi:hypothetical protein